MGSAATMFMIVPWTAVWQGDPTSAPIDPSAEEESLVHGSLSMRYRGRVRDEFTDHDLITTFALDIGADRPRGWSGFLLVDGLADLDGSAGPGSPFASLGDTYDSAVLLRVYEAHADLHGDDDANLLRVGRQSDSDTPVQIWYDGVRLEQHLSGKSGVQLGMYGGRAVRFYEEGGEDDLTAGAFATLRPWSGANGRIDWIRLEDDVQLGAGENTLFAMSLRQALLDRGSASGAATWLDGEERDVTLSASWNEPEIDLLVEVRGYRLFHEQNHLALELDPFTDVLLAQSPYHEAQIFASKGLGRDVRVEAGFQKRSLENEGDESEFNHGFEHAQAAISTSEVLPAGMRLSLSGERWNSSTNDVDTWGADVSKSVAERLDLSFGSAYLLYKTDFVTVSESEDVRIWYARLRSRPRSGMGWDVRYEYDDDGAGTSILRLGATWLF